MVQVSNTSWNFIMISDVKFHIYRKMGTILRQSGSHEELLIINGKGILKVF